MKTIRVLRTFQFADEGHDVVEYVQGTEADVSDECAQVAVQERKAELVE